MIKAVLVIASVMMLSSCNASHRTAGLTPPQGALLSARAPMIMTSGVYWHDEVDGNIVVPITGEWNPPAEGESGPTILRPVYVHTPEKIK